jgi:hypothetical protein
MRPDFMALLVLLALSASCAGASINAQELDHLIERARHRRQQIETYFRRIYEGESQLCARIPKPTPTDELAEDCLQGYKMG